MDINLILKSDEFRSAFGMRLSQKYFRNETARRPKEMEWLENLRQIKGLYDPGVVLDKKRSKVYPKMTRKYCNMVLSRLNEMLFPDGDRNWDMEPTPEPKIAAGVVNEIASALAQGNPQFSEQDLNLAIKKWCDETSRRMRTEIDDQILEIKYPDEAKKVLKSGIHYGTGIIKGPLTNRTKRRRWKQNDVGMYEEDLQDRVVPFLGHTRIWDWYPDMSITEIEEMSGSFERHVMGRHDLIALGQREDFDEKVIAAYIREHTNGDAVYKPWEVDLQSIESEAGGREGVTLPSGAVAHASSVQEREKRYEVLEYWGQIDAVDLAAVGITPDDLAESYEVQIWLLGRKVIMAGVAPGASTIYKLFYYEKDETSLYGEGLPRVMRHSQDAIGAASRMILDNGAVIAGPQTEINTSLLTYGQDITDIHPMKMWYREGRGAEAQYPALRPVQFESHISELMQVVNLFRELADEETCLPTWMISSPVKTNETAGGASMRYGMLTISVKDIVRNFDSFTTAVINDVYAWNMDNNPRPDIKGDFKVSAKGVSSLVGKEVRMQAMTAFKQSILPEDWIYVPRRDFLEEMVKTHDLRLTLRTEEEAQAYAATLTDPEMPQLMKDEKKADIAYRKAQALTSLSKAKNVNLDANRKMAGMEDDDPMDLEDRMAETDLKRAKTLETSAKAMSMAAPAQDKQRETQMSLEQSAQLHEQKMRHQEESHQMNLKHKEAAAAKGKPNDSSQRKTK